MISNKTEKNLLQRPSKFAMETKFKVFNTKFYLVYSPEIQTYLDGLSKNMTNEFCKIEETDCPSVRNIWQEKEVWLRPRNLLRDTLAAKYIFPSTRNSTQNSDIINLLLFAYKEICICKKIC